MNFYNSQSQLQNILFKELTINRTSSARYKSTRNSVLKINNKMAVFESVCFQQKVCSVLTSSCTLYFFITNRHNNITEKSRKILLFCLLFPLGCHCIFWLPVRKLVWVLDEYLHQTFHTYFWHAIFDTHVSGFQVEKHISYLDFCTL